MGQVLYFQGSLQLSDWAESDLLPAIVCSPAATTIISSSRNLLYVVLATTILDLSRDSSFWGGVLVQITPQDRYLSRLHQIT